MVTSTIAGFLDKEMKEPPFHRWLRPRVVEIHQDGVTISIAFRPELAHSENPGFFHGGVLMAAADIAGHAAIAAAQGDKAPTVNLSIEFLRPAPVGELIVNAIVRKIGHTLSRADIEILTQEKLVAIARGNFASLRKNSP
mgnify:CR=1 FL=1